MEEETAQKLDFAWLIINIMQVGESSFCLLANNFWCDKSKLVENEVDRLCATYKKYGISH